jgi:hypothetical protein
MRLILHFGPVLEMTTMNVAREENGEIVYVYKGKSLYEGLTAEAEAFVRVIFKELGEQVACSLSCVLAGETDRLVCITDLERSLIYDYARMYEFVLPDITQKNK